MMSVPALHRHRTTSNEAVATSLSSAISPSSTPLSITATTSSLKRLHKDIPTKPLPTTTFDMSQPQQRRKSPKLQQSRLTVPEQQELFRHVVEVRRIRNMELQLEQPEYYYNSNNNNNIQLEHSNDKIPASHKTGTATVSLLELAQRTGYGTNVEELETSLIIGQQAREKLITTNMGLVYYCVQDILKHRTLRSITTEDLIQEGAIGLSRAVDKYNPPSLPIYSAPNGQVDDSRNRHKITTSTTTTATIQSSNGGVGVAKFSTYAVYWIRAAILRTISERDDIMRVPEHVTTAIRKISNVAQAHGYQWEGQNSHDDNYDQYLPVEDIAPTTTTTGARVEDEVEHAPSSSSSVYWWKHDRQRPPEEDMARMIADETGYSDRMVQSAMLVRNRRNKYSSTVLSFESWMQQGQHYETDTATLLPQQQQQQRSSNLMTTWDEQMPNTEHMKQTLSRFLRPKEMEALSWRYGLNDHHGTDTNSDEHISNRLAKRDYLAETEIELFGSATKTPPVTKPKLTYDHMVVKGKWGEAMSFNDVGKQMQVSAEYGRRLCHAALQKLRQAVDDGKLEPALLF